MLSTIATAINNELDRFGNNPDYSYLPDEEYACSRVLSSAQSPALREAKALYRALCEDRISRDEYRLRIAFVADEL